MKARLPGRVARAIMAGMILMGIAHLPAGACYTGLAFIPTADMVGNGMYSIELQCDDTFALGNEKTWILNAELGLTPSIEAGLDYDVSKGAETRVLLNAKYLVLSEGDRNPAIAVGICDMGRHLKSSPYAVATKDLGEVRGHLGVAGIDGSGQWFAGVDKAVSSRLILMADYTSGDDNNSSVGFSYQSSDRFGITSGVAFPNGGGDMQFTIHFVLGGTHRHNGER
jgi:hypothetical protein